MVGEGEGGIRERLAVFDAAQVRRRLTYDAAIPIVRDAMIALSDGKVRQLLRSFIAVGEGRTFAIMPAAMSDRSVFGAKLVSVFVRADGKKMHEGLVILFDPEDGAPIGLADAGEITAIRTAAASAVATDALARKDASVLTILGSGRQAATHIEAIGKVRDLKEVRVWSRSPAKAEAFAAQAGARAYADAAEAMRGADIVCTVTAAANPILTGAMIGPGTHVNAVGSSGPAQAEIDNELVGKALFVADHREHVLAHGGEFLRAKAAGVVDDGHIAAEIGEVLAGAKPGRTSADQITLYKSLGHAAQDIAVAAWLNDHVREHP